MSYLTIAKIVGPIVLVIGIYLGGLFHGRAQVQQAWDASVTHQATLTATDVIARAVNASEKMTQYIEASQKTKTVVKTVEKEVVRYVSRCDVDAEFERVWDDVSRMRDESNDGVPTADAAASDPLVSGERPTSCSSVLRAYHYAIVKWREERQRYRALSQWIESDYAMQLSHRKE